MSTLPSELEPDEVRVWDPFVRIFHWGLVACIALNEFVVDDGERVHQWIGYAASALVLIILDRSVSSSVSPRKNSIPSEKDFLMMMLFL